MTSKDFKKFSRELGTEVYKKSLREAKNILQTVKSKLSEMTEEELNECTLDKILENCDISSEVYHNALGISERGKTTVMKRRPNEMWANNYNPHFMKA